MKKLLLILAVILLNSSMAFGQYYYDYYHKQMVSSDMCKQVADIILEYHNEKVREKYCNSIIELQKAQLESELNPFNIKKFEELDYKDMEILKYKWEEKFPQKEDETEEDYIRRLLLVDSMSKLYPETDQETDTFDIE